MARVLLQEQVMRHLDFGIFFQVLKRCKEAIRLAKGAVLVMGALEVEVWLTDKVCCTHHKWIWDDSNDD